MSDTYITWDDFVANEMTNDAAVEGTDIVVLGGTKRATVDALGDAFGSGGGPAVRYALSEEEWAEGDVVLLDAWAGLTLIVTTDGVGEGYIVIEGAASDNYGVVQEVGYKLRLFHAGPGILRFYNVNDDSVIMGLGEGDEGWFEAGTTFDLEKTGVDEWLIVNIASGGAGPTPGFEIYQYPDEIEITEDTTLHPSHNEMTLRAVADVPLFIGNGDSLTPLTLGFSCVIINDTPDPLKVYETGPSRVIVGAVSEGVMIEPGGYAFCYFAEQDGFDELWFVALYGPGNNWLPGPLVSVVTSPFEVGLAVTETTALWAGPGELTVTIAPTAAPDHVEQVYAANGTILVDPTGVTLYGDTDYLDTEKYGAFVLTDLGGEEWDLQRFPDPDALVPPEPIWEVNPGENEIDIEWPPVPGSTNAIVTVTPPSGPPVVVETPQNPTTIVLAEEPGEHEVTIIATGPGGRQSPPSAPINEILVETPLFETGTWAPTGVWNSDRARMWFATPQGGLILYEQGQVSEVDFTELDAFVEYQLQLAGEGAPVVVAVHEVEAAAVGFDELFPVKRDGDYILYLAMNQGASPDPTLHLRSYSLATDSVVDEIELSYQYPGHKWTWDAGHLFVNVTSMIESTAVIEVVNMFDPTNLTMESIASPMLEGTLSGAIITEGHLYVTGDDGVGDPTCWAVSLPSPTVLNSVPWLTDSEIHMGMLGPGWAIVVIEDGRLMNWDLTDPENPEWGDGAWLTNDSGGPFPIGGYLGLWQLLGTHAVDLHRIQSGAIAALRDNQRLVLFGTLDLPYETSAGVIYAEIDISTEIARNDMVITNVVSDAGWGRVWPQAKLGAVQTVGMMNTNGSTGDNPSEFQAIFVGSTPAQAAAYDPGPE